ncbi:MAG: hypothetical protein SA339_08435 [Methanomassiliicoccus sp.]|nr:hypothetical protein [Methanomassiliicoccus sp.]
MNEFDVKRREADIDELLRGLADLALESEHGSFSWSDMQKMLRSRPFYLEDPRTHRNKRRILEDCGYIRKVNKFGYRLSDEAYSRVRKLKGVPENAIEVEEPDYSVQTRAAGRERSQIVDGDL